jgi:hypothetical protein
MFFLIGGLQPRTFKLAGTHLPCRNCGQSSLQKNRTDQYLSLFFIPLFRVKKGVPYLECGRCRSVYSEDGSRMRQQTPPGPGSCPKCGRPVQTDFNLCPYCGLSLKSPKRLSE